MCIRLMKALEIQPIQFDEEVARLKLLKNSINLLKKLIKYSKFQFYVIYTACSCFPIICNILAGTGTPEWAFLSFRTFLTLLVTLLGAAGLVSLGFGVAETADRDFTVAVNKNMYVQNIGSLFYCFHY